MKSKLKEELKLAMKAQDKVKLETIRSLLTAIQYEEVAQKTEELPAANILEILKRELKKRNEEREFIEKAGKPEAIQKIATEISIIEGFLPKQMSAAEVERLITDMKNENPSTNMGLVMKALKEKFSGQYDAKLASELAKKIVG